VELFPLHLDAVHSEESAQQRVLVRHNMVVVALEMLRTGKKGEGLCYGDAAAVAGRDDMTVVVERIKPWQR
jgi:hypothetical protein